jgi:hypothetical protein
MSDHLLGSYQPLARLEASGTVDWWDASQATTSANNIADAQWPAFTNRLTPRLTWRTPFANRR